MGPLSGILSALNWAARLGGDAVVSVAVDTPFFPRDLVARLGLAAATAAEGVALAQSDALHPTFGLWPVALAAPLRTFLASGAKARVRQFAHDHAAAIAAFPLDGAFRNLNTREDLAAANALAAP